MDKSWARFWKDNYMLYQEIMNDMDDGKFYPDRNRILRFMSVNIETIKYVLLGMDPYPSNYTDESGNVLPVATGRSFEVANMTSWQQKIKQTSLRNMLRAIYLSKSGDLVTIADIRALMESKAFNLSNPKEWFDKLESQGVLFLNTALTVTPDSAGSHLSMWKPFTSNALSYISKKNSNVEFIAWGNNAYDILGNTVPTDRICRFTHPRCEAFVKENCFKKLNRVNWEV